MYVPLLLCIIYVRVSFSNVRIAFSNGVTLLVVQMLHLTTYVVLFVPHFS